MLHAIERSIHFKHGLGDGISAIYVNTVLRRLSLSLVGLFLPVYLFTKAQEFWVYDITHGLYGVILYFFFWTATKTLLLIPTANLISKVGYRWTITLSNVFWMLLLIFFFLSDRNIVFLIFTPFIHAFATCLYWLSYHSLFAEDGHLKHLGEEVGGTQFIGSLVSIAGPLAGGVIIEYWGFQTLFTIALFVMALSGIPFFLLPRHKPKSSVTVSDLVLWFRDKSHWNEVLSVYGRGMEEKATLTFWPLYMFLVAGTYSKQGFAASLSMVFGVIAIYFSGKYMDRQGNKKRLLFGSLGTSLLWIVRSFVNTFGKLLAVDVLMHLVSPFYWVNFESLVYKDVQARSENNLLFMTAKLLITSASYFTVLLFAYMFANTDLRFISIMLLAAIGSFLSYFIWEPKSKRTKSI